MLIVFLPWIYLMVFKYDIMQFIEDKLSSIFGEKECECPKTKTPY